MMKILVSLLISLLRTREAAAAGRVEGKLNVHLVCHTHDDAGWLKTVDQYYYGANNTIAHAGVQYILDSMVSALEEDPERKFVYAEQAFLWRWWRQQDSERRDSVRRLVSEGRLSFINGGWVMHDEAAAHYVGMVDQTHLGHAFLRKEFGEEALPRVAWQIDPFGHSATQASLLGVQAGFDALYFGRIDYQDRDKRIAERDMEMLWRASRSLEAEAQIFTGVFHSGNYGPPVGFCFDQACQDEPMMDDPVMADYNVERRASDFADACQELGRNTLGNDVMLQMGGDFGFENANAWFKNLEILMSAVNREGRVNAFFSTPQLYTDAKHASELEFSVKKDDFFPYADCPHCYWTGYFTSRPGLKRLERVTSGYLQAARQLHALAGAGGGRGKVEGGGGEVTERNALAALERAQALVQHHDGVSGTSKQHVADDYAQRLDRARVRVEAVVSSALSRLAFGDGVSDNIQQQHGRWDEEEGEGGDGVDLPRLRQCRFANVSVCDVTMEAESGFMAVAYNPLAQDRSGYIDVPISWRKVVATDAAGNPVETQVLPFRHRNSALPPSLAQNEVRNGGVGSIAGGGGGGAVDQEGRQGQHPYTLVLPVEEFAPLEVKVFHVSREAFKEVDDTSGNGSVESEVRKRHDGDEGDEKRWLLQELPGQSLDDEIKHLGDKAAHEHPAAPDERRTAASASRSQSDQQLQRNGQDKAQEGKAPVEDFSISNDLVTLTFDGTTGRIARMETLGGGGSTEEKSGAKSTLDLDQGWFYYPTFDGRNAGAAGDNGGEPAGEPQQQQQTLSGRSALAEASRLHGELSERLDTSQDQQKGGAYIFRPEGESGRNGATPVGADGRVRGEEEGSARQDVGDGLALKEWWVEEGPIVSEVHQVFSDWVTQTVRLRRGQAYAELDWTVGPIPVGASPSSPTGSSMGVAGKEVVSRFRAPSLASEATFYTDANGREFQRRVRNKRPTWDLDVTQPVAGNYYPVTAAAFVRDEGHGDVDDGMQLSILTDRAQGCSSLADGELELMAHRRLLTEDQRGVGEALNETTGGMSHYPDWERKGEGEVFRGTHYLIVAKKRDGMKAVRSLMDEVFSPFLAAFAKGDNEVGNDHEYPLPHGPEIEDKGSTIDIPEEAAHPKMTDAGTTEKARTTRDAATATTAAAAAEAAAATPLRALREEETVRTPLPSHGRVDLVYGGLVKALPPNVGLMTLMRVPGEEEERDQRSGSGDWTEGESRRAGNDGKLTLLVRLAHRYAKGEDPVLSLPAVVDLSQLVLGHSLLGGEEIALTGGGSVAGRKQRLRWMAAEASQDMNAGGDVGSAKPSAALGSVVGSDGARHDVEDAAFFAPSVDSGNGDGLGSVTIGPMEIKTYRLELLPNAL